MSQKPLTPPEQKLENSVELSSLSAYYGGLLTDKQRQALALHFDEDYSLGEIAEALGVSRQNVHDLIARAGEKLRAYEAALGVAARMEALYRELNAVEKLLREAQDLAPEARKPLTEARRTLNELLQREGETIWPLKD